MFGSCYCNLSHGGADCHFGWGIVLFAIYDINTSHTFHSIEIIKYQQPFGLYWHYCLMCFVK